MSIYYLYESETGTIDFVISKKHREVAIDE